MKGTNFAGLRKAIKPRDLGHQTRGESYKVGWKPNKRLPEKSKERREIQIKTEEFLQRGGVIQVSPLNVEACPIYPCRAFLPWRPE